MKRKVSSIKGVKEFVETCVAGGLKNVIISPGSRNAPLTISFSQHPLINCYSIPDERSAAFVALGMAQHLREPVAVLCTSGSAALNYSPAMVEAYYQKLPLIAITADRPSEMIGQGDGQTMNQEGIYQNFCKRAETIITGDSCKIWHLERQVNEVMQAAMFPGMGPVHMNVPFAEPLYETIEVDTPKVKTIVTNFTSQRLSNSDMESLSEIWNNCQKKMMVIGMLEPKAGLQGVIENLTNDKSLVVLTECTSNLNSARFISCIDRSLMGIPEEKEKEFAPELLLTFGGPIVSKKIKQYLRKYKPTHHWHVDVENHNQDTYMSLTRNIPVSAMDFLEQLSEYAKIQQSYYFNQWKSIDLSAERHHISYLKELKFGDFKVFDSIFKNLKEEYVIQLANSTVVRYAQLFKHSKQHQFFSNRGVSGIDGSTSTALGAAIVSKRETILITGDISFFYDSNAFWNHHVPSSFKVILINNGGGGIFRLIDGPSSTDELETYFEASHQFNAAHIAAAFGVNYLSSDSVQTFESQLELLQNAEKSTILEVFTPQTENAEQLKQYFHYLKGKKVKL